MADREFVFGRPDVQKLLRENFVIVAADDWYQRRQDDELGKFFRSVANQGPRKGAGGGTRQGRYAFSASGKLLGFNNNRDPQRILKMLRESLKKFAALPANERKAGAVKVPPLKDSARDQRYARTPPKGGKILRVHSRVLEKDKEGNYVACGNPEANTNTFRHNGFGSSTDHLWLTAEEFKSLSDLAGGDPKGTPIPAPIAMRIARFHLVDNTRGEPPHWTRDEVRKLTLRAMPVSRGRRSPYRTHLHLTGEFHLETKDGKRGYLGEFRGSLRITARTGESEFKLVAIGQHWGEGRYTGNARPGKNPLAVGFTLADPRRPEDRVPPQGSRWEQGYYQADRH